MARTPKPETVEKERKCLELRRGGLTYDRIAAEVGYTNRSAARKAVERALERTLQESADELRVLEADRLDRLQVAAWKAATGGDLFAIDRVLKIMDRRAKLFGLDAPTRQEHTGPDGEALVVEILPALVPSMADTDAAAVELEP